MMARVTSPSGNLFAGPPPTFLRRRARAARGARARGRPGERRGRLSDVQRGVGALAEAAFAAGRVIESYAYARTGYHRGLDALRRNGWKGHGPVPWSHEPNQGFLRCLHALGQAAGAIGESDEAERCRAFLEDSDPAAARAPDGTSS